MEKNYNDISHIESYLRGEMDDANRQDFEAQLAGDETLQREVAAYRKIFAGFKAAREEAFAADVSRWINEANAANSQKPMANGQKENVIPIQRGAIVRPMWRRVAIAASIVLLAIAGAWWMGRQYSDEKLVAEAYSAPLAGETMGPEQEQDVLIKKFEQAHELFTDKKYEEAAQGFREVIQGFENNKDKYDGLTRKFYLENSRWTLLLAELASGQLPEENFVKVLDVIAADPGSDYADEAKKLKEDLGSFWRKIAL